MRTATLDHTLTDLPGASQHVYELSASFEYMFYGKRLYTNFVLVSSVGNETMIFPVDGDGAVDFIDLFMSRPAVSDALALEAIGYRLDTDTP